jgi:hypothetical protein
VAVGRLTAGEADGEARGVAVVLSAGLCGWVGTGRWVGHRSKCHVRWGRARACGEG